MQDSLKDNCSPNFASSIEYWNSLEKPENVSVAAEEGDIVEIVNGVAFLLQTTDEYNNIVAYRVEKSDKSIVWTLLEFCKILYSKYHIEYVRVEGDKGKYRFLERLFTKKAVVKDKSVKERDVYYCNLNEAYKKLWLKCKEYDFYYNQRVYLTTTDEKLKKACFDKMFLAVNFAVETALKKRWKKLAACGVVRNDFEDMLSTITLAIMNRYKKPKGYCIKYLLTIAELAVFGILHSPRQRFEDSMLSFEAWQDYEYNLEEKS
jgi:hypothetical protein